MVAIRARDADAFVARPDPRRPIVLLFGPDAGLVRERVEAMLRAGAADATDPFTVVAVDGDVLAGDPGRLSDEARTLGLFGGRRLVHVRAGGRNFTAALEPLLADPPQNALILVEAGDLKRGAPLRKLLEASPYAAAIPCYADGDADLTRLVDRTVSAAGIAIDTDARETLVSLLGADRLATRSELDKLIVYAGDKKRIEFDDVRAVIADASALALDDVIDAAAAGDSDAALAALRKARAAGISAQSLLGAAIYQIAQLHRLSLKVERGAAVHELVSSKEANIHFRRHERTERALRRLTPARLQSVLISLGAASLAARQSATLADSIAEREILALARGGARPR